MNNTALDLRVQEIISGRRYLGRFPFPGHETVHVKVRVLTANETMDCWLSAQEYVMNLVVPRSGMQVDDFLRETPDAIDLERECQVLARSLFTDDSTHDNLRPFFPLKEEPSRPDVEQVRNLDMVLQAHLMDEYRNWLDATNVRRRLTSEQVQELVDAVKKEPNAMGSLAQYDSPTLRLCVRSLVDQWPRSPTSKSPTSSP